MKKEIMTIVGSLTAGVGIGFLINHVVSFKSQEKFEKEAIEKVKELEEKVKELEAKEKELKEKELETKEKKGFWK